MKKRKNAKRYYLRGATVYCIAALIIATAINIYKPKADSIKSDDLIIELAESYVGKYSVQDAKKELKKELKGTYVKANILNDILVIYEELINGECRKIGEVKF